MHSSQELLEVLTVSRHLLSVAVERVLLLLILIGRASVSILIVRHPASMPPSLALAHLVVGRIGELLVVLSLASAGHVLLLLSGRHLVLPAVYVLLVAWIRLYVVHLLVDQVELGAVIVDVVFVADSVLAVVYDLLLDQIATLA